MIGREHLGDVRLELAVARPGALHFEHERHVAVDEREQGRQREDAVRAVAQGNARQRVGVARGDRAGLGGQPVERRVVKDDRHVVGGALQVDLDGIARAHRGPDRGGAVLDDAFGRIVQAAMGDRPLQPIKLGHVRRSAHEGLIYRENRIDLDGGVERQARAADGDAGVQPLVAEDFDHQLRGGIEHLGMVGKAGSGTDEAVQAQQLHDAVEIAQRRLGLGQDVDGAEPRRLLPLARDRDRRRACRSATSLPSLSGN